MNQGLFLSRCGGAISQAIDLEWLARQYTQLPAVRVVDDFYDPGELDSLLGEVESKKLQSVVLAGESPYAFRETRNGEQLFRYLMEHGIDRNRMAVVNLMNMVVRAHKPGPKGREALQEKARLLIDVGLERVRVSHDLATVEIAPRKAVAIVGVSPGAMMVAHHLLGHGFRVHLLHRATDVQVALHHLAAIRPTLSAVMRHPRLRVMVEAKALDFSGYPGDFALRVSTPRGESQISVGAVVLSLESQPAVLRELQSVFHIDLGDDGRVAPRDETTARSQTQDRGVFVINPPAGQADDLASQALAADAAAAMVIDLLACDEIVHQVTVSEVDDKLCGGCGVCVKTCMFQAVSLRGDPRVSVIDPRRCRGCGNCVTACPAAARDLVVCPTSYLKKAVEILAGFSYAEPGGKVLLMACDGCGYRGLDKAAEAGLAWPVGIMPLWVVCGGQIDTQLIMEAFVHGFDGVALIACGEGCCHNLIGNVDLERRVNLLREILTSRGIDPTRLQVISTCSRQGADSVKRLVEFYETLRANVTGAATALR